MSKTIKQVSENLGISVYTLRYYEKEGLIPFLERDIYGNRVFNETDEEWIKMIMCLREIDMPIAKLREYLGYLKDDGDTISARRQLITDYLSFVERKIRTTIECLELTAKKIEQYDKDVVDIVKDCSLLKIFAQYKN